MQDNNIYYKCRLFRKQRKNIYIYIYMYIYIYVYIYVFIY